MMLKKQRKRLIDIVPTNGSFIFNEIFEFTNSQIPSITPQYLEAPLPNILDGLYINQRSGGKYISSFIERTSSFDENGRLLSASGLAQYCWYYYKEKWSKLWEAFTTQYSAIMQKEMNVTRIVDETANQSYNSTITDAGTIGTKTTTTTNDQNDSSLYGFNSSTPTPTDTDIGLTTETIEGLAQDNTTSNTRIRGGSDINDVDRTETITNSGRDTSPTELIMKEIELRKQEFYEILFSDLDKFLTLSVY